MTSPAPQPRPSTERILFGLLLGLHAATYLWLILDRRMVRGHDTLYGYLAQYLFLAHATQSAEPMLWMPYSTHGLISNFALQMQGGLLQNALLAVGGAPQGTNMLPLFHLCFFFEDLLLLLGMWSLGRRFYRNPYTRFFVAAAMVGSGMWVSQMYFNHRTVFAIPLILSLAHDFLEQGKRYKLFLALNLFLIQCMGLNFFLPGFPALVVLAYFGIYAAVFRVEARTWLRQLRPRPADLFGIIFSAVVISALLISVLEGTGELRQYRMARNPDGSVTLNTFLTFGGALNPVRYADLFLGITPSIDYSLYCGVCVSVGALLAFFFRPGKPVLHLTVCILMAVLFSAGFLSLVGTVAYGTFPPLHYLRYVSLASPFVKLFVILLAGHGFEVLLGHRTREGHPPRTMVTVIGLGIALIVITWIVSGGFDVARLLRTGMPNLADREVTGGAALTTALAAVAVGAVVLVRLRRPRAQVPVMGLLLLIHTADVYGWKLRVLQEETVRLDERQYAMQRIEPVPYSVRRGGILQSNPRYVALKPAMMNYGANYEISDAYLHLDPSRSSFWTTHWLAPYDLLLRARAGQPLHDRSIPTAETDVRESSPPGHPSQPYRKICGIDEDKIQVFATTHPFGTDTAMAEWMNQPGFRADVLGLSLPGEGRAGGVQPPPDSSDRVAARVTVLHFDANRIRVRVKLPEGRPEGWLFYADVWHPNWETTVNGRSGEVRRAFLAYKAVKLDAPESEVELRFRSPYRTWSFRLITWNALFLVGYVLIRLAFLFCGKASGP